MRNNRGISLVELVIVLGLVGMTIHWRKPIYDKFINKKPKAPNALEELVNVNGPNPWRFGYAKLPRPIVGNLALFSNWIQAPEDQKAPVVSEIAKVFGLSSTETWALLCDSISYTAIDQNKTKCTPAGGLVVAVGSNAEIGRMPVGNAWFTSYGAGTKFHVMKNDGSTFRFKAPYDVALVGLWTLPGTQVNAVTFLAFESLGAGNSKFHFFVENEEWESKVEWAPCSRPMGAGLSQKTGQDCLGGTITDPQKNSYQVGYEFMTDWFERGHQRFRIGSEAMAALSPAARITRQIASTTTVLLDNPSAQETLRQKCEVSMNSRESQYACVQYAQLLQKEGNTLKAKHMAALACDKGGAAGCIFRVEMASREKNQSDLSYWCRRAMDLKQSPGSLCRKFR